MKLLDYTCPSGHTVEHDFPHLGPPPPEELPCTVCAAAGIKMAAQKVKVYSMAGVRLPTGPATYNRGFLAMAILTGPEIERRLLAGEIVIDPFEPEFVNPASYDLRLGDQIALYRKTFFTTTPLERAVPGLNVYPRDDGAFLDAAQPADLVRYELDERGFVFKPGLMYLGCTVEICGAHGLVPVLDGKSSVGRLGVSVHQTAGFGDPGFRGQWTLEITVINPVRLYPGMQIAQVRFETVEGAVRLYDGHYKGTFARGPVASQAHHQLSKLRGMEKYLLYRRQILEVLTGAKEKVLCLTESEFEFVAALVPRIEARENITTQEAERLFTLHSLARV